MIHCIVTWLNMAAQSKEPLVSRKDCRWIKESLENLASFQSSKGQAGTYYQHMKDDYDVLCRSFYPD